MKQGKNKIPNQQEVRAAKTRADLHVVCCGLYDSRCLLRGLGKERKSVEEEEEK